MTNTALARQPNFTEAFCLILMADQIAVTGHFALEERVTAESGDRGVRTNFGEAIEFLDRFEYIKVVIGEGDKPVHGKYEMYGEARGRLPGIVANALRQLDHLVSSPDADVGRGRKYSPQDRDRWKHIQGCLGAWLDRHGGERPEPVFADRKPGPREIADGEIVAVDVVGKPPRADSGGEAIGPAFQPVDMPCEGEEIDD